MSILLHLTDNNILFSRGVLVHYYNEVLDSTACRLILFIECLVLNEVSVS